MKKYKIFLLGGIIGLLIITSPVLAQEAEEVLTEMALGDALDEEGLSDDDLKIDLEAENLPTVHGFAYRWERFRDGVASFFTFNAEKKAALYRERLHRLDRKMEACTQLGDEKCLERVESLSEKLTGRAEKYIEKKKEIKEKWLVKFQEWRTRREEIIVSDKERIRQFKEERAEIKEQWKANRAEAKERRENLKDFYKMKRKGKIKTEEIEQENKEEQEQLNQEQRLQNREQLIQMRSENVKDRLDATRERVQEHQEVLEELESE